MRYVSSTHLFTTSSSCIQVYNPSTPRPPTYKSALHIYSPPRPPVYKSPLHSYSPPHPPLYKSPVVHMYPTPSEIKRRVSISNIIKIECMKSCDKQITLSMISVFVGDNNAIKRHKNLTRLTQLRLCPPVCSISLILSQRSSKKSPIGELQ